MDNNRTEILAEIESRMQALREELGELENKVSELRKSVEAAEMCAAADETAPVDWSEVEVSVVETTQEPFVVDDMPEAEPLEESFPETVLSPDDPADAEEELEVAVIESGESEPAAAEPVAAEPAAAESVTEVPAAPESAAEEPAAAEPVAAEPAAEVPAAAEPVAEVPAAEEPAVHEVAASEPAVKQPVAAMPQKRYAWQTDLPGVPVKNIRSAISLYDRALFINTLFREDYALYDKTVGDLNAASSLEEAEKYLMTYFPDWNYGSEVVYGFMMAVRKKLG